MGILIDLLEAVGLILGSFAVAMALSVAGWTIFSRMHHPEWGVPAIALVLALALAMHLVRGQFVSMVTVLIAIAIPIAWTEARFRRDSEANARTSGADKYR